MNEKEKQKMLELLSDRAVFGLNDEEIAELTELEKNFPELSDESFDITAAALSLLNLDTTEQMPAHLQARIASDAEKYYAAQTVDSFKPKEEFQKTFAIA